MVNYNSPLVSICNSSSFFLMAGNFKIRKYHIFATPLVNCITWFVRCLKFIFSSKSWFKVGGPTYVKKYFRTVNIYRPLCCLVKFSLIKFSLLKFSLVSFFFFNCHFPKSHFQHFSFSTFFSSHFSYLNFSTSNLTPLHPVCRILPK